MTDITPILNVQLQKKGVSPVLLKEYDIGHINSFLQQAYKINARLTELTEELRSIRPGYLSTAPQSRRQRPLQNRTSDARAIQSLTDRERDEIDASSKQLLRQLNHGINGLKEGERARIEAENAVALQKRARGGLGAIGRWAAGGAVLEKSLEEQQQEAERLAVAAHREGVIYYLQKRLEIASRTQSEMMEERLGREMEKAKSLLQANNLSASAIPYAHDQVKRAKGDSVQAGSSHLVNRAANNSTQPQIVDEDQDERSTPQGLSSEQAQLFAEENADLLKHYEDQLDQVRKAERSILEISELHNTLHANLAQQAEHIDQLVEDSYLTSDNVGQGNKELKRASEKRRPAQAVFYATCAYCLVLIAWDLIF